MLKIGFGGVLDSIIYRYLVMLHRNTDVNTKTEYTVHWSVPPQKHAFSTQTQTQTHIDMIGIYLYTIGHWHIVCKTTQINYTFTWSTSIHTNAHVHEICKSMQSHVDIIHMHPRSHAYMDIIERNPYVCVDSQTYIDIIYINAPKHTLTTST